MVLIDHKYSVWFRPVLAVIFCYLNFSFIADQEKIPLENATLKIRLSAKAENSGISYLINRSNTIDTADLPSSWNSLQFSFTLNPDKTIRHYSYKLSGFNDQWSGWSADTLVSYSNLPSGAYNFSVRSRRSSSPDIIDQASYALIISAPWYKTTWAYLSYTLAVLSVCYLLIRKKLRFSFGREFYGPSPELVHFYMPESEKLINSLRKEELVAEVNFKNKELASVTMHLVERGKLLSKVREELHIFLKNNPGLAGSNELRIILRVLTDADKNRNDWEQFSIHFDEVHRNFLSVLKSQFPALSTTDLKLCAFLRLNLSSKEIAQSMNITVKGVEVSRYRLRKKLNLSKDINLFDYLLQITDAGIQKHTMPGTDDNQESADELAKFLSFFNKSMTAKFISQGGYDLSGEGIIFKGSVTHNK